MRPLFMIKAKRMAKFVRDGAGVVLWIEAHAIAKTIVLWTTARFGMACRKRRTARILQSSRVWLLLVVPALASAAADDNTPCLQGAEDYKRPEFLQEGLNACNRIVASRPVSGARMAFYYRGRVYWKRQLKDLDGAMEDFNLAINLDPENVEGYGYRADVWKARGDIDRAIRRL